jgi:hypothetical protein
MINEPPRALKELGREFDRVAEDVFAERRGSRRGVMLRTRRIGAVTIAAGLLLLGAAATAAVLLIQHGSPLPGPHAADLRAGGIPLAGTARLAGLDAADPSSSQPPWDLRLSRTGDGEICTAVGQVLEGRFGIVGLDHVFRELPLGGVDSCGIDAQDGPVLAGAHEFVGSTAAESRTVVSGVAGARARSVIAYARAVPPRRLPLGPGGSFITVYAGEAETLRPRIVITDNDGRSHAVAFESSGAFEIADPAGGSPWTVSSEPDLERRAFSDEDCVQVTREPGETEPSHLMLSLTPEVCGRMSQGPVMVSMRRFVPGEDSGPFPWGDSPSRTVVYGVAGPRVASLSLDGAGSAQAVPIDPHGGAFAAVLDGHIDPRALTLTAHLRDGSNRSYSASTPLRENLTNRPLAQTPVPAYRARSAATVEKFPPFELPIASTVRETLKAKDPSGGPTWTLRSWRGRPNPAVHSVGSEPFMCAALGVVSSAGQAMEPSAERSAHLLPLTVEAGRCNNAKSLKKFHYMLSLESFLDDPYGYSPTPTRAVVSGMLPPGASDAVLVGAGPARTLDLDANNAFLLVLPGRYWDATPRITYLLGGRRYGRPATTGVLRSDAGSGIRVPEARAPDPDGEAPWGFTASADCHTAIGRIVSGHLASIDLENGVLQGGASDTGSSSSCMTRPGASPEARLTSEQVEFNVQPTESYSQPLGSGPQPLDRPQIERRTLPGRTIITGVARADVVSVTISTPSDVRTLRPSGARHELLAVYDGFIERGSIQATIRLSDGRVVQQTIQTAGDSFAPPSLAVRRASVERELRRVRVLRGAKTHTRYAYAQELPEVEARLQLIERRLTFIRANPGVMPSE